MISFYRHLILTHLLEHIHFVTSCLFCHLAEHEATDLIIHNDGIVGVGLHIDYLIGFELFYYGENYLSHDLQDLEIVRAFHVFASDLAKIESMKIWVFGSSLIFWHDPIIRILIDLYIL